VKSQVASQVVKSLGRNIVKQVGRKGWRQMGSHSERAVVQLRCELTSQNPSEFVKNRSSVKRSLNFDWQQVMCLVMCPIPIDDLPHLV
jgi:hypothetical protein